MRIIDLAIAATALITAPSSAHTVTHTAKGRPGHAAGVSPSAAALVDAFHAALRRGDSQTAKAMLAPDALIFEEGAAERSRAEYASAHLAADAAFTQAVPSSATRRSGGGVGDIAWVATEGRTTGTFNAKPVDRVTTETMVLHRVAGAWKIVHIHWSSAARK